MTKHSVWLLLVASVLMLGCGEPSAPPPGAPTGKPEAPQIEGLDTEAAAPAPKEDKADPTTSEEQ